MRIRTVLAGAALVAGMITLPPVSAQATTCIDNTGVGVVDDKVVYDTCWDCGWIMIRGEEYLLFYCD